MPAPRRNLVFCRAGEGSLHRQWIGDPAARSYDVWLDCYCDPARWAGEPAEVTDGRETTKWPRLAGLLAERPEAFARYEAVWLPDDDLAMDAGSVEAFFDLFHRHGLALAQPALAEASHWSHELTLAHPGFLLRYTNFVEVMAPAFSRPALEACAPTFSQSRTGWGLDLVWPRVLGDPRDRVAIVDATPMVHTRPVGASYAMGESWREMESLAARFGVSLPFRFAQYGGVARAGRGAGGRRVRAGLGFYARLIGSAPRSQRTRSQYWKLMYRTLAR
jgi:hypothetical protein